MPHYVASWEKDYTFKPNVNQARRDFRAPPQYHPPPGFRPTSPQKKGAQSPSKLGGSQTSKSGKLPPDNWLNRRTEATGKSSSKRSSSAVVSPGSRSSRSKKSDVHDEYYDATVLNDANERLRKTNPVEWRRQRQAMKAYGVREAQEIQEFDERYRHPGEFPNSPLKRAQREVMENERTLLTDRERHGHHSGSRRNEEDWRYDKDGRRTNGQRPRSADGRGKSQRSTAALSQSYNRYGREERDVAYHQSPQKQRGKKNASASDDYYDNYGYGESRGHRERGDKKEVYWKDGQRHGGGRYEESSDEFERYGQDHYKGGRERDEKKNRSTDVYWKDDARYKQLRERHEDSSEDSDLYLRKKSPNKYEHRGKDDDREGKQQRSATGVYWKDDARYDRLRERHRDSSDDSETSDTSGNKYERRAKRDEKKNRSTDVYWKDDARYKQLRERHEDSSEDSDLYLRKKSPNKYDHGGKDGKKYGEYQDSSDSSDLYVRRKSPSAERKKDAYYNDKKAKNKHSGGGRSDEDIWKELESDDYLYTHRSRSDKRSATRDGLVDSGTDTADNRRSNPTAKLTTTGTSTPTRQRKSDREWERKTDRLYESEESSTDFFDEKNNSPSKQVKRRTHSQQRRNDEWEDGRSQDHHSAERIRRKKEAQPEGRAALLKALREKSYLDPEKIEESSTSDDFSKSEKSRIQGRWYRTDSGSIVDLQDKEAVRQYNRRKVRETEKGAANSSTLSNGSVAFPTPVVVNFAPPSQFYSQPSSQQNFVPRPPEYLQPGTTYNVRYPEGDAYCPTSNMSSYGRTLPQPYSQVGAVPLAAPLVAPAQGMSPIQPQSAQLLGPLGGLSPAEKFMAEAEVELDVEKAREDRARYRQYLMDTAKYGTAADPPPRSSTTQTFVPPVIDSSCSAYNAPVAAPVGGNNYNTGYLTPSSFAPLPGGSSPALHNAIEPRRPPPSAVESHDDFIVHQVRN